jgi:hypothetical protein
MKELPLGKPIESREPAKRNAQKPRDGLRNLPNCKTIYFRFHFKITQDKKNHRDSYDSSDSTTHWSETRAEVVDLSLISTVDAVNADCQW